MSAALHNAIALKRFNISLLHHCQSSVTPLSPFQFCLWPKRGSQQWDGGCSACPGMEHWWETPRVGDHLDGGTALTGRTSKSGGNDWQGKGRAIAAAPCGHLTRTLGKEGSWVWTPASKAWQSPAKGHGFQWHLLSSQQPPPWKRELARHPPPKPAV